MELGKLRVDLNDSTGMGRALRMMRAAKWPRMSLKQAAKLSEISELTVRTTEKTGKISMTSLNKLLPTYGWKTEWVFTAKDDE